MHLFAASPPDRYGSMALFFGIALVIMAPVAIRMLRRNAAAKADTAPVTPPSDAEAPPAAATSEPNDLAAVIAAIDEGATTLRHTADEAAQCHIAMPREALIDGRLTPESVTTALVRDAIRRSGLAVVDERIDDSTHHFTCRLG